MPGPVNVTLLFSKQPGGCRRHLRASAAHRCRAEPDVGSVASVFVSRWDAFADKLPGVLENQLGIAGPPYVQGLPQLADFTALAAHL